MEGYLGVSGRRSPRSGAVCLRRTVRQSQSSRHLRRVVPSRIQITEQSRAEQRMYSTVPIHPHLAYCIFSPSALSESRSCVQLQPGRCERGLQTSAAATSAKTDGRMQLLLRAITPFWRRPIILLLRVRRVCVSSSLQSERASLTAASTPGGQRTGHLHRVHRVHKSPQESHRPLATGSAEPSTVQ